MKYRIANRYLSRSSAKVAIAIALVVLATLIRFATLPSWIPGLALILFYPTVLFCTWMGGFLLGGLATVLSILSLALIIYSPVELQLNRTPMLLFPLMFEGLLVSFIIDRLQRRERLAHEQRSQYTQIFINQAPAAIAMVDREMRYLAVSRRWLTDFRIQEHDVLGRCHYDVFPELPERWKQVHKRCLNGAIEKAEGDMFVRQDGTKQWISWEVRPWFADARSSEVGGLIMFSEDITSMIKAYEHENVLRTRAKVAEAIQAEAERLNKSKDEFIATLSHELRSPLNAMLGWVQLIRRAQNNPERLPQALGAIERSAHVLAQIISDILDINRIRSGKLRLSISNVSLETVIQDALELALPPAQAKNITLEKEPPLPEVTIQGDPVRLQQCLSNLLSNAIKFTPSGGRVVLSAHVVGETIQISVKDTGQGIQAEALPHIFERYVQADSSSSRAHGGLGLGLTIVKHLVELHGGTVSAHSAGLGHGSVFTVTLPLSVATTARPALTDTSGPIIDATDLSGRTLLIVDDDLEARELLRGALEDHGAVVHAAASADEGLAVALKSRLDLMISDIAMPNRDGYSFISGVRATGIAAPAIALTAFSGDLDVQRALRAGFQRHITKPVKLTELFSTINDLLSQHPSVHTSVPSSRGNIGQASNE